MYLREHVLLIKMMWNDSNAVHFSRDANADFKLEICKRCAGESRLLLGRQTKPPMTEVSDETKKHSSKDPMSPKKHGLLLVNAELV